MKLMLRPVARNADYLPALAQVDSKLFGIAFISTDNQSYTLGDVTAPFSIQSTSKVYSSPSRILIVLDSFRS